MVDDLTDYQWSSHLAYMQGRQPNWLTLNWVLSMFGDTVDIARQRYTRFMEVACPEDIYQRLRNGTDIDQRILGDDGFHASLGSELTQTSAQQTLMELTQQNCRRYKISEAKLACDSRDRLYSRIRAEIGLAAIEGGIATNAEIARFFSRSQSGMSRAINDLRKHIHNK
jgi:hypothetical protein